MQEIWKDIKDYEGLYQISNFGRVKNKRGHILKPKYQFGYCFVNLISSDKKRKRKPIHRLVATAFIPNPNNKPCVDHIDTVRDNNIVSNLRWCTYKENMNNVITKERVQKSVIEVMAKPKNRLKISDSLKGKSKKNYRTMSHKKVICIETKIIYKSIEEAALAVNKKKSSISMACRYPSYLCGGYHWKYLEKEAC